MKVITNLGAIALPNTPARSPMSGSYLAGMLGMLLCSFVISSCASLPAQSVVEPPGASPTPASVDNGVMLQSINYPDYYISYQGNLGEITPQRSALEQGFASFRIVPGLANANKVSFESVNKPGHYLRHQGWRVKLHKNDGSRLFRDDATFAKVPGLANESWVSFESHNYPGKFLRHRNFHLWVERGNTPLFRNDATFKSISGEYVSSARDKQAYPIERANYWEIERANYWGYEIAILKNWTDAQSCARRCDKESSCVVASYHDRTAGGGYANTCVLRSAVGPRHPEQSNVHSWVRPTSSVDSGGSCYWMTKVGSGWGWIPAERGRIYKGEGKHQCYLLDSCDGGMSRSSGGCYKWAFSAEGERIPWGE